MVTASIVDGLGRGYQVKKNAEVDGKRKMIVSLYINSKGEMMTFDAFVQTSSNPRNMGGNLIILER